MKRVVIESPYKPKFKKEENLSDFSHELITNISYAILALKDCLKRNESPYASHLLLTRVLDDENPEEREKGLKASHEWLYVADLVVFYVDYGYSEGMKRSLEICKKAGLKYEERRIL